MRIEELYQRPSAKPLPVRIQIQQYALNCCIGKEERKPKMESISVLKLQSQRTAGSRKRNRPNKMKIDQVNRHEESSYLLDEETNQAILQSIVAKDELSKYLTPLRFMEIDTWRKEVPYGLNNESDNDRRKWRTPLEILCSVTGQESNAARNSSTPPTNDDTNAESSNGKQKPSTLQLQSTTRQGVTSAPNIRRSVDHKHSNGKNGVDVVGSSTPPKSQSKLRGPTTGHQEMTSSRPMTSPDRHPVLMRINSERLLSSRQKSSPTPAKVNGSAQSRFYSSHDGVVHTLYNRPPVVSTANLRHSIQLSTSANSTARLHDIQLKERPQDIGFKKGYWTKFGYSTLPGNAKQSALSEESNAIRPRIRSDSHLPGSGIGSRIRGKSDSSVPAINPHPPDLRRQNSDFAQSDPNIAYIPVSPKRFPVRYRKDAINQKVKNYYAARIGTKDITATSPAPDTAVDAVAAYNSTSDSKRRLKSYSSNHRPPSQHTKFSYGITPRIVYANDVLSSNDAKTTTFNTHHSPWVTQALPDLSVTPERLSSAERDGYYVRKPSKTVSFQLDPRDPDQQLSEQNVSMLLVKMSERHSHPTTHDTTLSAARTAINSPRSSVNVCENPNNFSQAGTVPTITVRQ